MAHDVFISFSSKNKTVVDAVCASLEKQNIRCWIAPRDVPPGQSWAASIVDAISKSKVFVLVFSDGSNKSKQVIREVGEAVDNGIPIVPLRIEDVEPSKEMRYYIKSIHWLDAITPPLEKHLQKITNSVQALLSAEKDEIPPQETIADEEVPAKKRWPLPTWATVVLILAAVVVIGGIGGWVISQLGSSTEDTSPIALSSQTEITPPTEMTSPTENDPTEEVAEEFEEVIPPNEEVDDWRPLTFMIPNQQLWEVAGDDRYTAVEQNAYDAFAWSTETYEGNLILNLDLESSGQEWAGCVIVYGAGHEHSYGSLIFCIEWDFYTLEKHTTYHDGENFLTYSISNVGFNDEVYSVTIEVQGDVASMFVNGQMVLSTFFDTDEIERWGRIGLHKQSWKDSEITFANVQIRSPVDGDQSSSIPEEDEFECNVDSSGLLDYYPITSPFSSHSIEVDGRISSTEEWSEAACVDFRLHYSVNFTNPNFQRGRWWVQNDDQNLFFLVRVSKELAVRGVFVNYFWPENGGGWAHSDGVDIKISGEIFDHGQWDDLEWHEDKDLDPPGTVDVEAASSEDDEFYWFEIKRPLNSGDSYDWAFELGQKYGDNPYDSVMIGIELDEGEFLRYLQLELGEP